MRIGGVNNMKKYKIAVAGTGYVGLSIATLLSQHHHTFMGILLHGIRKIDRSGKYSTWL